MKSQVINDKHFHSLIDLETILLIINYSSYAGNLPIEYLQNVPTTGLTL